MILRWCLLTTDVSSKHMSGKKSPKNEEDMKQQRSSHFVGLIDCVSCPSGFLFCKNHNYVKRKCEPPAPVDRCWLGAIGLFVYHLLLEGSCFILCHAFNNGTRPRILNSKCHSVFKRMFRPALPLAISKTLRTVHDPCYRGPSFWDTWRGTRAPTIGWYYETGDCF